MSLIAKNIKPSEILLMKALLFQPIYRLGCFSSTKGEEKCCFVAHY